MRTFNYFIITILLLFLSGYCYGDFHVEDYRTEKNQTDVEVIQAALNDLEKAGHGTLHFDGSKTYKITQCLELPRYCGRGRLNYVFEGHGTLLIAKHDSIKIFNRIPKNQREALNKMMRARFIFKDFTFRGGAKGINLGATFGSQIIRCNFQQHKQAAVDIQFGLQTRIEHCYATNCFKENFVLRTGSDWGGNSNNSQSNHSVIESCRVYARKGANSGYKILGSGGCVINNVISEGSKEINYGIYADRLGSTTVRMLTIRNVHIEHTPLKSGLYIRMTGNVIIEGIFYQLAYKDFPLIHAGASPVLINIKHIPHYVNGTIIKSDGGAAWNLMYSHKKFYLDKNWRTFSKKEDKYLIKKPFHFTGQGGSYQIKKKF